MSDSVWPHRQQPTRLPHPWDSPGKNTGVGYTYIYIWHSTARHITMLNIYDLVIAVVVMAAVGMVVCTIHCIHSRNEDKYGRQSWEEIMKDHRSRLSHFAVLQLKDWRSIMCGIDNSKPKSPHLYHPIPTPFLLHLCYYNCMLRFVLILLDYHYNLEGI